MIYPEPRMDICDTEGKSGPAGGRGCDILFFFLEKMVFY